MVHTFATTEQYIERLTIYMRKAIKNHRHKLFDNVSAYIWHYNTEYIYEGCLIDPHIFHTMETRGLLIYTGKHRFEGAIMERYSLNCADYPIEKYKRVPIPFKLRMELLIDAGFKCAYCGNDDNLEIDHILPVSKGGNSDWHNLQVLCRPCNRQKYNKF